MAVQAGVIVWRTGAQGNWAGLPGGFTTAVGEGVRERFRVVGSEGHAHGGSGELAGGVEDGARRGDAVHLHVIAGQTWRVKQVSGFAAGVASTSAVGLDGAVAGAVLQRNVRRAAPGDLTGLRPGNYVDGRPPAGNARNGKADVCHRGQRELRQPSGAGADGPTAYPNPDVLLRPTLRVRCRRWRQVVPPCWFLTCAGMSWTRFGGRIPCDTRVQRLGPLPIWELPGPI